jgi:RNA polymerase-binding transcription factor DksA
MSEAARPFDATVSTELRRRLLEARDGLLRTIGATDAELAGLGVPEPGSPPEQAATVSAAALLSRLQGQEKHELDEITDALARLESGTYGVCQGCGHAVPLARLRALPAARHCLGCQARQERRP